MSERLKLFSTDELIALLFSMDIAEAAYAGEADQIRQEFIAELKERGTLNVASPPVH
jgi:hypothetical protein